jgi:RNA polymerase sigma factor (sigma-70 family)
MTANDLDLLRQFARDQSQDAFTALVNRHVNLVYSAALRQVRSPQLAEEIAQSVFADLAHSAPRLQPDTILTAWLYAVTRRTAVDAIRKESRRQLREQIAVEMTDMNATTDDWKQIAPLLDEAIAALDETDRAAVLLRYFENKSLREVGQTLGTTDDTAQKRVSRAVERLRDFFTQRRVTLGAGGLAAVISANAVQAAPAGLAAVISATTLAGTAVATSTLVAATKTIAMTTLQKTLVTATIAVIAGAGIYEAREAAHLREQNQTLQQSQAPLAEQIQRLQRERDAATNRLVGLLAENSRLKSNPNQNELLKLRGEVTRLRPLQRDVTTLKKLAAQSMSGLPEWKPDQVKNVGRATPQDALQTFLWSGNTTNLSEIGNSLVGDENDPPSPDALREFINDRSNHPFSNDGVTDYRILSQTLVSSDEVQLEINALFGGSGISVPLTLRNVNGAWKLVVFNIRDKDGKVSQLGFRIDVAAP